MTGVTITFSPGHNRVTVRSSHTRVTVGFGHTRIDDEPSERGQGLARGWGVSHSLLPPVTLGIIDPFPEHMHTASESRPCPLNPVHARRAPCAADSPTEAMYPPALGTVYLISHDRC